MNSIETWTKRRPY